MRVPGDADHRELAAGDFHRMRAVELAELEEVAERLGLLLADQHVDFHLVFEMQRVPVIARRMDAGPAHRGIGVAGDDGEAQRAEERVLGGLHVFEEVRVVDDARHVRLAELDAAKGFELEGHGQVWLFDARSLNRGPGSGQRKSFRCIPTGASARQTLAPAAAD